MYVERTFTVTREISGVFDFLADFTTTEQWDPGTVSTVRTHGDGGVGTTYDNVSEFMGRKVEVAYETVEHRAPNELRLQGRNKASNSQDWFRLSDLGSAGTSIHYRADFHFTNPVVRAVAPLVIRRKLERLADETVEQLQGCLV